MVFVIQPVTTKSHIIGYRGPRFVRHADQPKVLFHMMQFLTAVFHLLYHSLQNFVSSKNNLIENFGNCVFSESLPGMSSALFSAVVIQRFFFQQKLVRLDLET